jgi:hypothetical protein
MHHSATVTICLRIMLDLHLMVMHSVIWLAVGMRKKHVVVRIG